MTARRSFPLRHTGAATAPRISTLRSKEIDCAALHRRYRGRPEEAAGRRRRAASTTRSAGSASTGARVRSSRRPRRCARPTLGYQAHPFAARTRRDGIRRGAEAPRSARLAIAGFAAMNIMLLSVSVWAGSVTDITPETRDFFHWLSALIALPAAAFAGQPFFTQRLQGAPQPRAPTWTCRSRIGVTLALGVSLYETAVSCRACLFRQRHHAPLLPACRPHARSRHAAEDPGGRRQSRGAQGRDCREADADGAVVHGAGGGASGRVTDLLVRPGRTHCRRRDRAHRRIGDRREPRHRRDAAARRSRPATRSTPARSIATAR